MNNTSTKKTYQEQTDYSKTYERIEELEKSSHSSFEPLPLQREKSPPRPFPFEALGSVLGGTAQRLHLIVKAPDAICGQSVLAAASYLTEPYADIYIDGRVHPISLFMLTVAESGDRKSSVEKIVLKSIEDYQAMLKVTFEEEKSRYRNKLEIWKRERDQIFKNSPSIKLEEDLEKLGREPIPPLEPFLLLEEPTYEGIVKLFAIGQPSLGLFSDEGGRMLSGHAMQKDNLLKTACGLSSLWDGKAISRIRGGDENLLLYGRRFSMHLMIQEVVLHSILKNELLVGQGLLARCLIVAPETNAGNRKYNPVDVSNEPIINKFHEMAYNLLDHKYPLKNPDIPNELAPKALSLDFSAKEAWIKFHDEIDDGLRRDGKYYSIRRMANKAAEQALRISAVLAIFENFEVSSISLEYIDRGITLMRYYLDEAIRISDSSAEDPELNLAQTLLNWMESKSTEQGNKRTFPLSEIYQKGPKGVRNAEAARRIMKILESHRRVKRNSQGKEEWAVLN